MIRRVSGSMRCVLFTALGLAGCTNAAFAATVTRGPFLQLQEPDAMTVVWWTDVACPGEVAWGLTTSYGQLAASPESATRHEIRIGNLTPDTLCHYRVRSSGVSLSADATFRTAPPADAMAVSFAFVGDSCSAPANATKTYNAMLPWSVNGFCVTLGDLAGRGEDNITDYWQSHFFNPAAAFIKQIAMYPCIGNHEIYDETSFPDYVHPTKYLANWSLPTANSGSEMYYSFDKGPVHFISLDTWWSSYASGSEQRAWLARDLTANRKPWTIAFAHNGPYVSQLGGSDGSSGIRTSLVPLFEQHDVDMYLFGHYHDYQRNEVNGVTYVLQGTGGQELTQRADDSQSYVHAYAKGIHCFTRLDVRDNRMLGWCLRTSDGAVLDGWQLDKPRMGLPLQDNFPSTGALLNWTAPWSFASQCRIMAKANNPSGDGYAFEVGDSSGQQFAYPMLAPESMKDYSIEAQVFYDATSSVKTRCGIGVRGRQFFSAETRSYYGLFFVRNDPLAADGTCVLVCQNGETETVLASWPCASSSGWHKLKLASAGIELTVWIDNELKTLAPISGATLAKGRPFVYNYRATSAGSKSVVDDVAIAEVLGPTLITDFENYVDGSQVVFRQPSFSSTSSGHILASPNTSKVVTAAALGGTKVCEINWGFVDTTVPRWLRLTTSGTANVPNPTVDLTRPITFRFRLTTPGSLRLCLGIRETGTTAAIGANGGTTGTIEWLGAESVVSSVPQGRLISDQGGQWQQITFDPQSDPVRAYTGNGVLSAANNKGTIEHLAITMVDGAGPFSLQLDLLGQAWRETGMPPTITQHPSARTVCPGTATTLSITATGTQPRIYRWFMGSAELSNTGGYEGATTDTLSISAVQSDHAGVYTCQVSNQAGEALSDPAELVLKVGTTVTQPPQPASVHIGAAATFSLQASGEGVISYLWQKDGETLVPSLRCPIVTSNTLTLSSVTRADAGAYRCLISAGCGNVHSVEATLDVLPTFAGDFDHDSDVDLEDFSYLQLCFDRQSDVTCLPANLAGSDVIDATDVVMFADCLSGADKPPPAECLR